MRYFRKGTRLIAIEPSIQMHVNLKKAAIKYGIDLEIRTVIGEAIDLPDNFCEFVVSTLVLCSVDDPGQCVQQIRRILKPLGKFAFIEHVSAKRNSVLFLIQWLVHRPWHWFFEGCHTNHDTKKVIQSVGFTSVYIEEYKLYSPFIPIMPQIRGIAVKIIT